MKNCIISRRHHHPVLFFRQVSRNEMEETSCSAGSKWWQCGHCEELMTKNTPSIRCIACFAWIHLTCAKLNYKEAKKRIKTFNCSKCVDLNPSTIDNGFAASAMLL